MNNKEKYFVLKRIIPILPLELLIFSFGMLISVAVLSKINDIVSLSGKVFSITFVIAGILGILSPFFSIRLLFKNKIKRHMMKKILVGMIIIQVIVFGAVLISGYNLIDQIIEMLREEVNIYMLLYGDYYYEILDASVEIWRKYCLITITTYTIGSFFGIVAAGIKMNDWLVNDNTENEYIENETVLN